MSGQKKSLFNIKVRRIYFKTDHDSGSIDNGNWLTCTRTFELKKTGQLLFLIKLVSHWHAMCSLTWPYLVSKAVPNHREVLEEEG